MKSTDATQMVFLDKSALIAYMDPENPNYPKANSFFTELDDLDRNFITTNHIIFTVHQWMSDHHGYVLADCYLNIIDKAVQQGKLFTIPGSLELENKARELLFQYSEFQITLEEALIAIVMSIYQIKRIFTFNRKNSFLSELDREIKVIPSHFW